MGNQIGNAKCINLHGWDPLLPRPGHVSLRGEFGSVFVWEKATRRKGSTNDLSRQRGTVVWLIFCRSLERSLAWFQIEEEPWLSWVYSICCSSASILPSRSGRTCGKGGLWWSGLSLVRPHYQCWCQAEAGKMVSSRASSLCCTLEEITYTIPPIAAANPYCASEGLGLWCPCPSLIASAQSCAIEVWEMLSFSSWVQEGAI